MNFKLDSQNFQTDPKRKQFIYYTHSISDLQVNNETVFFVSDASKLK